MITIPYAPREAFDPLHERRQRYAIVVAHRRAGKTVACINELIRAAFLCRHPQPHFAYFAPLLNQAKDIAWRYLLHYTECFGTRRKMNASELWVELPPNGGRIQLYGAINPDRMRGLGFDGVVLDEYGDMTPETWSVGIRPTLSGRDGWGVFIGTPKGHNGFHRLWRAAENEPEWLRLELKASQTRLLSQKELADARKSMSDDEYAQEYECSFEAAIRGAYWGQEMAELEAGGRIGSVPYDPGLPVDTAWDLGMADSTVIWFFQRLNWPSNEIRVIDVLKGEGEGLEWYVKRIQERDWVWGSHFLPHDVNVRELGTGQSRLERLYALGLKPVAGRKLPLEDGIQAVRSMLPLCWFDREKCAQGIEALKQYRRDFDTTRQEYETKPRHDWTSHYADAMRYYAVERRLGPPASARFYQRPRTDWIA